MSGSKEDNFLTGGDRGTAAVYGYNTCSRYITAIVCCGGGGGDEGTFSVIELSPIARHKQIIFTVYI